MFTMIKEICHFVLALGDLRIILLQMFLERMIIFVDHTSGAEVIIFCGFKARVS